MTKRTLRIRCLQSLRFTTNSVYLFTLLMLSIYFTLINQQNGNSTSILSDRALVSNVDCNASGLNGLISYHVAQDPQMFYLGMPNKIKNISVFALNRCYFNIEFDEGMADVSFNISNIYSVKTISNIIYKDTILNDSSILTEHNIFTNNSQEKEQYQKALNLWLNEIRHNLIQNEPKSQEWLEHFGQLTLTNQCMKRQKEYGPKIVTCAVEIPSNKKKHRFYVTFINHEQSPVVHLSYDTLNNLANTLMIIQAQELD